MTAPNELIESFTAVVPPNMSTQAAADQIAAAGYFGSKPPENTPITDSVTPVKQVVNTANQ